MNYHVIKSVLTIIVLLCTITMCEAQSGWSTRRLSSSGKDLNAIYFIDTKRGWVGGDNGFLSYTDDGGASWVERRIDTQKSINDIYFVSKDSGFVLAGGTIFNTLDGGHNWREAHKFLSSEFQGGVPELYSLRFNGRKRGWVVGSISRGDIVIGSLLAITRDGGTSWQLQDARTQSELIHLDFVDDKHGWIVGTQGAILHTDDAGETWTPQASQTKLTLYHVDFRNEKHGLAVGEHGTILTTEDGGHTWTRVFSPVRYTLLSVQFVGDQESWIVGRNGAVLRSSDGGSIWVEQQSNTKQNLYALFMSKKNGWAVGSDGLMLHYEQ